jgi:hypothetical protein
MQWRLFFTRFVYARPFRAIGVICAASGVLTAPLNVENRQLVFGAFIISLSLAWTRWRTMKWLAVAGYSFFCLATLLVLLHQAQLTPRIDAWVADLIRRANLRAPG